MHRLPIVIALLSTAVLVAASTYAAPHPTARPAPLATTPTRAVYAPLVANPPTPTPTPTATATPQPTPIPPPLSSIVIQPSQVSSGYTIDDFREIGNDESATSYLNPTEARQKFIEQGRESSWFVRYLSAFLAPLGIADQGIRYLTIAGADAGLDYAIADIKAKHPDYTEYSFVSFGDRSVAIRWGFIQSGHAYYQNYYAIRKGRYVALVQVLYYQGDSNVDPHSYARKAEVRLPNY